MDVAPDGNGYDIAMSFDDNADDIISTEINMSMQVCYFIVYSFSEIKIEASLKYTCISICFILYDNII